MSASWHSLLSSLSASAAGFAPEGDVQLSRDSGRSKATAPEPLSTSVTLDGTSTYSGSGLISPAAAGGVGGGSGGGKTGNNGPGDGSGGGKTGNRSKNNTQSYYFTLGSGGVWLDSNTNGLFDNGETYLTVGNGLTASTPFSGYYTFTGIDVAAANVTVRVVDGVTATPLDLTGFGSGDKIIIDGLTSQSSRYGCPVSNFIITDVFVAGPTGGKAVVGLTGWKTLPVGNFRNVSIYQ